MGGGKKGGLIGIGKKQVGEKKVKEKNIERKIKSGLSGIVCHNVKRFIKIKIAIVL